MSELRSHSFPSPAFRWGCSPGKPLDCSLGPDHEVEDPPTQCLDSWLQKLWGNECVLFESTNFGKICYPIRDNYTSCMRFMFSTGYEFTMKLKPQGSSLARVLCMTLGESLAMGSHSHVFENFVETTWGLVPLTTSASSPPYFLPLESVMLEWLGVVWGFG